MGGNEPCLCGSGQKYKNDMASENATQAHGEWSIHLNFRISCNLL
ncbi:SEC-C metal-binding domain-containing protein [Lacicoccus alkaliphilus]